jgi:hypothetical protein
VTIYEHIPIDVCDTPSCTPIAQQCGEIAAADNSISASDISDTNDQVTGSVCRICPRIDFVTIECAI